MEGYCVRGGDCASLSDCRRGEGGSDCGSGSDGGGSCGEGVRTSISDGDRCLGESDRRDTERRIFSGVAIAHRLLSFSQWNRSNEAMLNKLKILIQMLLG
jgi:hypothetical protein